MPYQLHSKQTAAGSVRLPGIRLGEGERRGSREERRQKGMGREGGEVRRTRRDCKNDEMAVLEKGKQQRQGGKAACERVYLCICVCGCICV